jgi:hypothetical protein
MKNETYEEFVEKFKPKKTTDDCYTPPEIYELIKDWACKKYGIKPDKIIRPFWPGGDYQSVEYPEECVVLDNPPFSILAKICDFYLARDIQFFLFAPSLTCFNSKNSWNKTNHIVCDCSIEYENGAVVKTSFITNYEADITAQTAPDLTKLVNDKVTELRREKKKQLPKYSYPDHLVTAAMLQKMSHYGIDFKVRRRDCMRVRQLDAQKATGKEIFGYGLLLSEKAAVEKAAAEKAAAEKAAAEKAAEKATVTMYSLSEREVAIVQKLGTEEKNKE